MVTSYWIAMLGVLLPTAYSLGYRDGRHDKVLWRKKKEKP